MQSELNKYAQAFGEVQAAFIDEVLLPQLSPLERFLLVRGWLPARVQQWIGRRKQIAIVRSLISGGHRLTILKGGRVLGYTDFKLTNDGWVRQEPSK